MAVNLSPLGGVGAQFFDSNGNPLSGGLIYTYAAGTSTPVATYTSSSGLIQHSNPIVLDAAGRVPTGEIWLTDGISYKFTIKTSADVLVGTYDNIVGINSNFIAYTAQQEIQTATAGQTVFNLTTMQYQPATNNLSVFVDGVNQYGPGAQYAYVETDSDTVTFVSGLHVGASVKFTTASPVSSGSTNAENVAYDPPFTGAVGTNVETQLAQFPTQSNFTDNLDYLDAMTTLATGEQYVADGAKIGRVVDRLFVGGAAVEYGGGPNPDIGTSWLGNSTQGPAYLASNATLLAYPEQCRYGIVGAAKTSLPTGAGSGIGIGAILINDGALPGWGQIIEVQHETTTDKSWGLEIALKNASGVNSFITPVSAAPANLTTGVLMAGGGDNAFGPAATNPCTVGIMFATGNGQGWNTGILFRGGSLPTNEAIALYQNHTFNWYGSDGGVSGTIKSTNSVTADRISVILGAKSFRIENSIGKSIFYNFAQTDSVNRVQTAATAAGVGYVQISAEGDDTDIDLQLVGHGAGLVRFGVYTGTADVACNGYITIKDFGGTTRKLMTTA